MIHFVPLSSLNSSLNFNYIGIIPYVVINEIAYPFLGVSGKIPTIVDLGSSISKDNLIHTAASDAIYTKTCRLLSVSPEDFLQNGYILYQDKGDDGQSYLTGIIFICLDIAETVNDLNNMCYQFRSQFITEHKIKPTSSYCDNTHLLWMNQRNFIYIIRNTTYKDGELDEDGNEIRKENPSGNIRIDESLKSVYTVQNDETPISLVYDENAHVPRYFSKYPEMDPFLRNLLADAFEAQVDFFFTFYQ